MLSQQTLRLALRNLTRKLSVADTDWKIRGDAIRGKLDSSNCPPHWTLDNAKWEFSRILEQFGVGHSPSIVSLVDLTLASGRYSGIFILIVKFSDSDVIQRMANNDFPLLRLTPSDMEKIADNLYLTTRHPWKVGTNNKYVFCRILDEENPHRIRDKIQAALGVHFDVGLQPYRKNKEVGVYISHPESLRSIHEVQHVEKALDACFINKETYEPRIVKEILSYLFQPEGQQSLKKRKESEPLALQDENNLEETWDDEPADWDEAGDLVFPPVRGVTI